jgi:signal transduction histidine kinase
VAAADAERRKVERDLHDGAQQRLVALRIKVELARELAQSDPEVAARLADLGDGLEDVLTEVRELAQGIRPPVLRDFGLLAALASAAERCAPPAALVADGVKRYPDEVETAVYFCCVEALQNVGKHAGANAHAEVRLARREDELCFEIVDDGHGCDVESARSSGAGFTNMRERVAALGGTLTIESASGRGTQVRGQIPLGR